MIVERVRNETIWGSLRVLFMGAAVLFLINIYFGFDNILTVGEIPRWQVLIHLHAGSIGWITLTAIGFAIWVLTGQRDVPNARAARVRSLALAAVVVFSLYIPNFWLAFSRGGGPLVYGLPTFGSLAVLTLWASAIYALTELRKQGEVTTVQLLATGALLVASIGATVGMLLGLERAIGRFLPLPEGDRVGAHAGMMDAYLFLYASAVAEWILNGRKQQRWTWPGLVQAVAWTLGASLVPVAFFLNMLDQLLPIFLLLLLLGLIVFLARTGWRVFLMGPVGERPRPWIFFGAIWLVLFMGLFLYGIPQFPDVPSWFGAAFAHAGFVGMMTNLILGIMAVRSEAASHVVSWGEGAALWLLNLGLILFIGLKIGADVRWGAAVMGVGVLLGVLTMLVRLRASGDLEATARPNPSTARIGEG